MPPMKPLRKFNSTIAELYVICRLCWNSCLENIADFSAFKTFYDSGYANAALAEIDAAEALPGEEARNLVHESFHQSLQTSAQACLTKWRMLRAYIKSAVGVEYYKMNVDAAGGSYYETAVNENWEDLQQLMNEGKQYMTNNIVQLTTNGMPAGFPALYDADFVQFTQLYNQFKDAQMDAEAGTIVKMNANNFIYEKTQAMNFDGQTLYENDPERYDRFVFARVKELVSPEGGVPSTSLILTGVLKNGGTQQPIVNFPVQLITPGAPDVIVNTNELGRYVFEYTGLTPGTITSLLKVEAPGFVTFEKELTMTIGTKYSENITLTPA